jgi:small subunit ribosomal protein S16
MAVKIRLKRIGAKKNPYYRIVVADARFPRDGRFIEQIGTYDPMANPSKTTIDGERARHWIKNGAQPTDTVRVLLKKSGALNPVDESAADGAGLPEGAADSSGADNGGADAATAAAGE